MRMSFYTAGDLLEVEGVTGGYLKDNTLIVTTESGEEVPVYKYKVSAIAAKALKVLEEHVEESKTLKSSIMVCCLP